MSLIRLCLLVVLALLCITTIRATITDADIANELLSLDDDELTAFLQEEELLSQKPAAERPLASVDREDEVRGQLHEAIRSWSKANPEKSQTVRFYTDKDGLTKKLPRSSRFRRIHVHIHHKKSKKVDNRALNKMVKRLSKQHKQASVKIAEILYRLKRCAGRKTCLPFIKKEMSKWKRDWIRETQAIASQ